MPDSQQGKWPAILDLLQDVRDRLAAVTEPDEGLRERKKRLMRERISDTATAMFLDRGFEDVRVSEVAAACGVSEKTIFNYFPTKESLIFDSEEEMAANLRKALGPGESPISPVEATVELLGREADLLLSYWEAPGLDGMGWLKRFTDLVENTPALKAARVEMMERLTQVAAQAMADRAGVNPDDPEPQIAADSLIGLWRVYYRGLTKFSESPNSFLQVADDVMSDVRRAARLIDTGLWSFGMAVQGANGRQQIKAAAEAANEARKQVTIAIKQARESWRTIKAGSFSQVFDDLEDLKGSNQSRQQKYNAAVRTRHEAQRAALETRRKAQAFRAESQQSAQEMRREAQELRKEAQLAQQLAQQKGRRKAR